MAENPVAITTMRKTGDSGQGVIHSYHPGLSQTYGFPTPENHWCSRFTPRILTLLNSPVGKVVFDDRARHPT